MVEGLGGRLSAPLVGEGLGGGLSETTREVVRVTIGQGGKLGPASDEE